MNEDECKDEANRLGGSALMSLYCFLIRQSEKVNHKVEMIVAIKQLSRKANECDIAETTNYYKLLNRGGFIVPVPALLPYVHTVLQILRIHVNFNLHKSNTVVYSKQEIFKTNKTKLNQLFKGACEGIFHDARPINNQIIEKCQKQIGLKLIHTYCAIRLRQCIDKNISRVALAKANKPVNSSRREQSKHAGHS